MGTVAPLKFKTLDSNFNKYKTTVHWDSKFKFLTFMPLISVKYVKHEKVTEAKLHHIAIAS